YPLQFRGATLRFVQGYLLPDAARDKAIEDIGTMLAARTLRPSIAATFPLDRIADAHQLVENGRATGNVVLTV
ncbi:zinc-binding dehydrogenase, partial [Rhizobiaceae sp. 2RAB30]